MDRPSFVTPGNTKYNGARSSLSDWFQSEQGRYVLEWELPQFDSAVEDAFGYRAAQFGLPEIDFLRQNRIPYRFSLALEAGADVAADALQLPLATHSLDLLVMPHTLETHSHAHAVLREAERVLRPEGHLVLSGFNPVSMWRIRQWFSGNVCGAPWDAHFIGLLRLHDWLHLLGFELNGGRFGCYAPPFAQRRWLSRYEFMERAGDRWWPIAGGVYVIRAIKRVRTGTIIAPAWRRERARRRALATLAQRNRPIMHRDGEPR